MNYEGPIIDIHTHIFPDKLRKAIHSWFVDNAGWRILYYDKWQEALSDLERHPRIKRYLTFGYAHKPGIARELNDFYAKIPAAFPKALPLMCAHQDDEDLPGLVREGFSLGLRGIKLHCQVQEVLPTDERLFPIYETVIEEGGFIVFHAGTAPFPCDYLGFERFAPLLERYPELKCVVAHLGCYEPEKFLEAALDHENLYLDTAYNFLDSPRKRMDAPIELVREASHKIFFASDFPGISHTYDEAIASIDALEIDDEAKRAIFHDNAAGFLGL